jgi:hypothetical protein
MSTHEGIGQAARKLWPEEVITGRYHLETGLPGGRAAGGSR